MRGELGELSQKTWEALEEWNAKRKEYAEKKGVKVYQYKIVDDKDL